VLYDKQIIITKSRFICSSIYTRPKNY